MVEAPVLAGKKPFDHDPGQKLIVVNISESRR
jgi:hypothetical protein